MVFLTGGTPVLQQSIAAALVERGARVRVHGAWPSDRGQPAQVEPWEGDLDTAESVRTATAGCEAIVAIDRSVVDRTVTEPMTPLTHDFGSGAPPRILVVTAPREGDVSAPGTHVLTVAPVYGIADDPITTFLIMMRSLPAVPIVGGSHMLQPLWHGDLARMLAAAATMPAAAVPQRLRLAGPDSTTAEQLYEAIARLIDRRPMRIPLPDFVAAHATWLWRAFGTVSPFDAAALSSGDANLFPADQADAAASTLGVQLTRLEQGLLSLIDELASLTPAEGVGRLDIKRFWADIHGSPHDATGVLRLFQRSFADVMPIPVGVEPAAPNIALKPGATVTMSLPGRGHVQVRVVAASAHEVVVSTLRGHALAGFVRFSSETVGDAVRFSVTTCDRAGSTLDWMTLRLGGSRGRDANWTTVVENVVTLTGGTATGVEKEAHAAGYDEAALAERWIRSLIDESSAGMAGQAAAVVRRPA